MKSTHTIVDIENLMHEYAIKIQEAETKTEKKELLKKLKQFETHYNNCQEKHINGKKYPMKKKPIEISKKALLELIDSVEVPPGYEDYKGGLNLTCYGLMDVTGIFPPFTKK